MGDLREVHILKPVVRGTNLNEATFEYKLNSAAINLTSAVIKIAFKRYNSEKIIETFVIGDGIIVTNAIGGIFKLDKTKIINWPAGIYYADIDVTLADGSKANYIILKLEVPQNIGNDA